MSVTEKLMLDQAHSQLSRCSGCMHGMIVDGRPVCAFNGSEIRFFDAAYSCGKGYWRGKDPVFMFGISEPRVSYDEDSKTLWLNRPDTALAGALDAEYPRVKDEPLHWHIGDKPPRRPLVRALPQPDPVRAKARSFWESLAALPGQAIQMAQVVTSGSATPEVVATRRASCEACPARKDAQSKPIPVGTPLGENQWCGDCGCGTKPWAKLDSKLTYAYLPCPRQQPGFSSLT